MPIDEVIADVNLVWANCRGYNPPGSPVLEDCRTAQLAFQERWLLAGLPSDSLDRERPLEEVLCTSLQVGACFVGRVGLGEGGGMLSLG